MHHPPPILASLAFLVQGLNEFSATLPPSVRAAYEQVLQGHVNVVTAALAPPKGDETTTDPAQTRPAA